MRYLIFLFFSLLLSTNIFSQDISKIDSLQLLLADIEEDVEKLSVYNQIFDYYINNNNDSALKYVNLGFNLAKREEDDFWKGKMNANKGRYMIVKNDLFNAKTFFNNANEYFIKVDRKYEIAETYLLLGNINLAQGNFSEALQTYLKGLEVADKSNIVEIKSHIYNNLGVIYYKLNDLDKSLENYENAVILQEEVGNLIGKAAAHTNISNIHTRQKNFEDARYHINAAYEIGKNLDDKDILTECIIKSGSVEQRQGNHEKALEYFFQALEDTENLGQDYMGPIALKITNLYIYIGTSYFELNEFLLAKEYLLKGYEMAHNTGQLELLKVIANKLYEVSKSRNQYQEALQYYEEFSLYSDSIESDENIRKIAQLEMQYQFDKKRKEEELIQAKKDANQKRKELIYLMVTGGIFLGLVIFILLFLLQKNKVKRIELNEKNLQLQLESKNRELTTNVMYLLKKNEFIVDMVDRLKKAKLSFKPETSRIMDKFIKELESETSSNAWEEFETRFQEVHSDFYNHLTQKFPDLTPNELRLCAFLRLNMSSKEIGAITFQSFSTLTTARYRLRKKLGIDRDENLISFLTQL